MDIKNVVKILSGIVKICGFIIGFASWESWIPDKYKGVAILVFAGASIIGHFAEEIEKLLQPAATKLAIWFLKD